MALPEMKQVPPGCETVECGRHPYICDPSAPLAKGQRAAVWGMVPRPGGGEPRRIATSGTYRPRPGDEAASIVRLGNWCGPQRGWEETAFPCPPNTAARVIGTLAPKPGKRHWRGRIELQKFLARRLRSDL
jgi:hypothetical protein